MVAKITVPGSIHRALNYNEQKVAQGKATCLMASGFLKESKVLNVGEKLARMQSRIQLNGRAKTNTVHISLNFAAGERLSAEKLKGIATLYMEKIGFSNQPFLVYEHRDAGHPHLHIVTTNIRCDGTRISLHNLGRGASEKARRELEVQFGLIKASDTKKGTKELSQPALPQKISYGKGPTKQAITNVLDAVLPHYKYASLPELNAILQRYNILADRGVENGIVYRSGGLVYRVLDEGGNKVGVPLKASALYNKPTLSFLEQRFKENGVQKERYRKQLQTSIDWVMVRRPKSFSSFEKELQKEHISLVIRSNQEGFVYGLTYIDHCSKTVFNGSELGKPYSAKGVMEKCGITQAPKGERNQRKRPLQSPTKDRSAKQSTAWNKAAALQILERLLTPETQGETIPMQLKKQKKKRRRF